MQVGPQSTKRSLGDTEEPPAKLVRPPESSPEVTAATAAYAAADESDSMNTESPMSSLPHLANSEYAKILQLPEFQDDPILTILEKKLQDACDGKPDVVSPDPSLHIPLKLIMNSVLPPDKYIITWENLQGKTYPVITILKGTLLFTANIAFEKDINRNLSSMAENRDAVKAFYRKNIAFFYPNPLMNPAVQDFGSLNAVVLNKDVKMLAEVSPSPEKKTTSGGLFNYEDIYVSPVLRNGLNIQGVVTIDGNDMLCMSKNINNFCKESLISIPMRNTRLFKSCAFVNTQKEYPSGVAGTFHGSNSLNYLLNKKHYTVPEFALYPLDLVNNGILVTPENENAMEQETQHNFPDIDTLFDIENESYWEMTEQERSEIRTIQEELRRINEELNKFNALKERKESYQLSRKPYASKKDLTDEEFEEMIELDYNFRRFKEQNAEQYAALSALNNRKLILTNELTIIKQRIPKTFIFNHAKIHDFFGKYYHYIPLFRVIGGNRYVCAKAADRVLAMMASEGKIKPSLQAFPMMHLWVDFVSPENRKYICENESAVNPFFMDTYSNNRPPNAFCAFELMNMYTTLYEQAQDGTLRVEEMIGGKSNGSALTQSPLPKWMHNNQHKIFPKATKDPRAIVQRSTPPLTQFGDKRVELPSASATDAVSNNFPIYVDRPDIGFFYSEKSGIPVVAFPPAPHAAGLKQKGGSQLKSKNPSRRRRRKCTHRKPRIPPKKQSRKRSGFWCPSFRRNHL